MGKIDVGELADSLKDYLKKQQECAARGHPNSYVEYVEASFHSSNTYVACPDCGARFSRRPTPDELNKAFVGDDISR